MKSSPRPPRAFAVILSCSRLFWTASVARGVAMLERYLDVARLFRACLTCRPCPVGAGRARLGGICPRGTCGATRFRICYSPTNLFDGLLMKLSETGQKALHPPSSIEPMTLTYPPGLSSQKASISI